MIKEKNSFSKILHITAFVWPYKAWLRFKSPFTFFAKKLHFTLQSGYIVNNQETKVSTTQQTWWLVLKGHRILAREQALC